MFKRLLFILLIILSTFMILWSGNYIYKKQSKLVNYNSFLVSDSASIIYIPNTNELLKQNLNHLKRFNLPSSIQTGIDKMNGLKNFNFNKKISREIYLSYDKSSFSIVFNNEDLTISAIIKALLNQFKISAVDTDGQLVMNDKSYFYKQLNDYFVFSNNPIQVKTSKFNKIEQGNYHYYYQNNTQSKKSFVKLNDNTVYNFSKNLTDSIKGKPVSPFHYFKLIPSDFEELNFYGSQRFDVDYTRLIGHQNKSDFFNWINNSFIFLKKGEMELIIGQQNENQNLKNILDEQTLELSEDSLLPTPLFKNNMEISFFKSNFKWQNILPQSNGKYEIYTELNDYNILANSMDAIDWFIKSNQLGTIYSTRKPQTLIPQKVNRLTINQTDSSSIFKIENRINNSTSFTALIKNGNNSNTESKSLVLAHQFLIKDAKSKFIPFYSNDTLTFILFDNTGIDCYNLKGEMLWSKPLESPLIETPKQISINNKSLLVLMMQNQIDLIDENGNSIKGFPYKYNGNSNHGLVIKYADSEQYRLLIQIKNTITNLNIDGTPVEGWNFKKLENPIKSPIYYDSKNGKDYIYFKDSNDTLNIINRKGENRFPQKFKFKLKNESPYLTGDYTKGNLRKIGYQNGYITSQFANDGHLDSIKLSNAYTPSKLHWTKNQDKLNLVIEEFNRIIFLNEFGFVEKEIQKPQPNLIYLKSVTNNDKHTIFANIQKNELYLLNSFGNQLNTQPIKGNENFALTNEYFIVYFNSQLWLYKL